MDQIDPDVAANLKTLTANLKTLTGHVVLYQDPAFVEYSGSIGVNVCADTEYYDAWPDENRYNTVEPTEQETQAVAFHEINVTGRADREQLSVPLSALPGLIDVFLAILLAKSQSQPD